MKTRVVKSTGVVFCFPAMVRSLLFFSDHPVCRFRDGFVRLEVKSWAMVASCLPGVHGGTCWQSSGVKYAVWSPVVGSILCSLKFTFMIVEVCYYTKSLLKVVHKATKDRRVVLVNFSK